MRNREALDAVIKAYDVRGVVGEDIDEAFVRDVGAAFASLLREENETTVAIGHDMRPSSPQLADAFAEGVTSQGLDVIQLGLCATDQLYFAAGTLNCAGAMFTASHNPAQYNGIKLCRKGATPVGEATGLATIKNKMVEGIAPDDVTTGTVTHRDILSDYADFLNGLVGLKESRPLVVAVDAANGMGGHTVPAVFDSLPFDVRPLYFELDGTFPNHEANPLDPKNLVDLQKFVVEQGADIGLAFDGDADRCFVVDEKGAPVSPSAICALIAERYLEKFPSETIIHNLITSRRCRRLSPSTAVSLYARAWGTPLLRRRWQNTRPSLVASTRRTTTSKSSGTLILACSQPYTCWLPWGRQTSLCLSSWRSTPVTTLRGKSTPPSRTRKLAKRRSWSS